MASLLGYSMAYLLTYLLGYLYSTSLTSFLFPGLKFYI